VLTQRLIVKCSSRKTAKNNGSITESELTKKNSKKNTEIKTKRSPSNKQFQLVRVVQVNVHTVREDHRLQEAARQAARANLIFATFQETKRRNTGSKLIVTSDRGGNEVIYEFHWRGFKKTPNSDESLAGVGILIKHDKYIQVEDVCFDFSPRLISVTALVHGIRYHIII
jgi:hypothetical protein